MSPPSTLVLEPATVDDVPALTEVWFAAFAHDPEIARLWPDTPRVRAWWDGANRGDMLAKPFQRFVKVVDPDSADARGRARIAAWAKWDTSMPEARGRRYPPWCEDMPGSLGGLLTWGADLDTLVTHPDYQRRGAGSLLLKWGCELADENGVGAYVDASKAGKGLYERFGFVDESEADAGEVASMARRRLS
ncbi:hypothetical protein ColLi_05076 [Colletotrichum liriopes]|uniref:N-acetyltransferase domain-containing protein n=1 Tax=Colletotrichum liriopes TaxID=708192 RepID=A0AA37GL64_9PEZI|nr:hypothetical protein ColLi_05076 [Colletotrichum liriopes]